MILCLKANLIRVTRFIARFSLRQTALRFTDGSKRTSRRRSRRSARRKGGKLSSKCGTSCRLTVARKPNIATQSKSMITAGIPEKTIHTKAHHRICSNLKILILPSRLLRPKAQGAGKYDRMKAAVEELDDASKECGIYDSELHGLLYALRKMLDLLEDKP